MFVNELKRLQGYSELHNYVYTSFRLRLCPDSIQTIHLLLIVYKKKLDVPVYVSDHEYMLSVVVYMNKYANVLCKSVKVYILYSWLYFVLWFFLLFLLFSPSIPNVNFRHFKLCLYDFSYIVVPSERRMMVLFTFLKKNRKKKVMVFLSTCMSVKYHHELFNYIDLPVMSIHVSKVHIWKDFNFSITL